MDEKLIVLTFNLTYNDFFNYALNKGWREADPVLFNAFMCFSA